MVTFHYRAKKDTQNVIDGQIEADNEQDAVEKINALGLLPIKLEKKEENKTQPPKEISKIKPGRIKHRQITLFSRQMASLLKSGVPILRALSIIAEQADKASLNFMLNDIHDIVEDGGTFSSALEKYPKIFPSLYISIVHAGENSGSLPEALMRISDYREKQHALMARLRMAMVYPSLMAFVGLGTVIFMLSYVVPKLAEMFVRTGQELPMPTRILIDISTFLQDWWLWILIACVFLGMVISRSLKTESGKLSFGRFQLKLPIYGEFILKSEISRFARTLEILIRNGITILKALDVSIPVLKNEVLKNALKTSYEQLERGRPLGESLKDVKVFPLFMTNLLIVGEETGSLDEALSEVASSYERDTDEVSRILANLMEPLIILFMGLIVGFIVMAMLLPIFEINM
ncbi:type II secretion system F family protein [PVC group bacterium]|nr:type II secretion system F family protein [PVC group bacterium]